MKQLSLKDGKVIPFMSDELCLGGLAPLWELPN